MKLYAFAILIFTAATLNAQDKYAVVIGVETYDTSIFSNLEYAGEDANDIAQRLTEIGFKATVMTTESTSARLRPTTPKKIDDVISAVASSCTKDDTLLIALSGHGVQFSDEEPLPTGVRETYFCPSDADLADKSTMVKISSIVDFMNQSPASRKLLLVDACQENRLSAQGQKSTKRIELGSIHENRRSVPAGMAVLFSCSSGQFSWEHEPLGHSVFSHHVIEYLAGNADSKFYDVGKIELNGLVSYVSKQTNDYVIGTNLCPDGQLPVLRGDTANWSLGKLQGRQKDLLKRVIKSMNDAYDGTLLEGEDQATCDMRNACGAVYRLAAKYLLGGEPLENLPLVPAIERVEKCSETLDEQSKKEYVEMFKSHLVAFFTDPSRELPVDVRAAIVRFLSFNTEDDAAAYLERPRFHGVHIALARSQLLGVITEDFGSDLELCKAYDQLLLEPLSGLETVTEDDSSRFNAIIELLIERLYDECHFGRVDYCQQLRARLEAVAKADKLAKEEMEHAVIGSTLRMRGSPGMLVLQSIPIEHGLDEGWSKKLHQPLLLMYTFCDCGTETKAVERLRTIYEEKKSHGLQVVLCVSTDEAEQKIKPLVGSDFPLVRTKSSLDWVGYAPFFVLFDKQGRVVTSFGGLNDKKFERLNQALDEL